MYRPGMFDSMPLFLRVGPWSNVAKMYIVVFGFTIIFTAYQAFTEGWSTMWVLIKNSGTASNETVAFLRVIAGLYGFILFANTLISEFRFGTFFATKSFTMYSWVLLSARLMFGGLSKWYPSLLFFGEVLRYPVIVQHTTVLILWWLVVGPTIAI